MSNKIKIYTDGGCHGNPGPGGWAFVLTELDQELSSSGYESMTTNNRMELTAVIKALQLVQKDFPAKPALIVTDSQYVKNGITQWIHTWIRNGWKTSQKSPVKNKELWQQLLELTNSVNVEWAWVKGHAGDHYNEMCDSLVQDAINSMKT
ncbi:ribonuclease HI [Spirochaeta dissipatitropha]